MVAGRGRGNELEVPVRIASALILGSIFGLLILGAVGCEGSETGSDPPTSIDQESCDEGVNLGSQDAQRFGCDEVFFAEYKRATESLRWCYDVELERVHDLMCAGGE